MSVPPVAKATLQAAVMSAGSNVLAQGIKAYRDEVSGPLSFDVYTWANSDRGNDEVEALIPVQMILTVK